VQSGEEGLIMMSRFALFIVLGTLPAVGIGFFLKDFVESNLRSILVIALASIFFCVLLALVDESQRFRKNYELNSMNMSHTFIIGFAQAFAFIPWDITLRNYNCCVIWLMFYLSGSINVFISFINSFDFGRLFVVCFRFL